MNAQDKKRRPNTIRQNKLLQRAIWKTHRSWDQTQMKSLKLGFELSFQNSTLLLNYLNRPQSADQSIISECDGPTEKFSSFTDKLPIANQQKSYQRFDRLNQFHWKYKSSIGRYTYFNDVTCVATVFFSFPGGDRTRERKSTPGMSKKLGRSGEGWARRRRECGERNRSPHSSLCSLFFRTPSQFRSLRVCF